MPQRELPMLAGIGAIIHWCEELASLLAGPILTAGLGIALIDLLTDGKLLATTPALLFAWAISQTVGLDAQLVGSAAKLGQAMRRRAGWPIVGYAVLVLALGYVAFQASNVFATQQAEGLTTAQALARLGMDGATWIIERSALAVVLVILSGLLRYTAPAPAAVSIEDERAKLERELTLEPLRQRLRAQQVGGIRALAETALRGLDPDAGMPDNRASVPDASDGPNTSIPPDNHASFEATQRQRTEAQGTTSAGATPLADTPPAAETSRPPSTETPSDEAGGEAGDDRPPTGPGSPTVASNPRRNTATPDKVTPLRRGLGRAPKRDKRTASRANARGGKRGNAEQRIRAVLAQEPDIAFDDLVRRANVSPSTASKYVALWQMEHDGDTSIQRAAQ